MMNDDTPHILENFQYARCHDIQGNKHSMIKCRCHHSEQMHHGLDKDHDIIENLPICHTSPCRLLGFERHGAAITASHDTVTQEQQDSEIALLHSKNAFLARSAKNTTHTMEQQKVECTK